MRKKVKVMQKVNQIIEVRNLKKYFKTNKNSYLKSVDDVSFSISKGEILGLIGESGCGKSTTGKTLLKLYAPTGGSVKYKDKILYDVEQNIWMPKKELATLRKDIQIIFQDPYLSLDPKQCIQKALSEGAIKHEVVDKKEVKEYCEEMLQICGINPNLITRFPHEFSGGQRQRIGIARALAVKPEFIVCDEVTASLDVSVQSQILNLLLDLRDKLNLTYLFISHNISVVQNMCDRIAVMYLGQIVEIANAKEVCKTPMHPYSKFLISSVPKINPWDKKKDIDLMSTLPVSGEIPLGCRFHTRCKYATEKCKKLQPRMIEISKDHYVSCHLYENNKKDED